MSTEQLNPVQFRASLEEVLHLPAGSVMGSDELRTLEGWDSLAMLEVMMMVSADYSSEVEPADIASCTTVDDLAAAVSAARVAASA